MRIVKIISEHKRKLITKSLRPGYRRVMAIVEFEGRKYTKHSDISENMLREYNLKIKSEKDTMAA